MIYKDQKNVAFNKTTNGSTAAETEVVRFNQLAEEWRKPRGAFKVVHAFNATRVEKLVQELPYIFSRQSVFNQPLTGLTLLDVGCGAGIATEPISKLGAKITAIDASERNILIARQHAEKSGLAINYQRKLPEDIAASGETFDVVISLEVVEHVANADAFLKILSSLIKPGSAIVIGTINRTPISFIKAIDFLKQVAN